MSAGVTLAIVRRALAPHKPTPRSRAAGDAFACFGPERTLYGSDWPVSSHEPLHGLQIAVTRQVPGDPDAGVLHEAERITRDQALAAYTAGVAYQAGEEAVAGTIAVGQRADLVLTGADVTRVPDDTIGQVPVAASWRAGTRVHG